MATSIQLTLYLPVYEPIRDHAAAGQQWHINSIKRSLIKRLNV